MDSDCFVIRKESGPFIFQVDFDFWFFVLAIGSCDKSFDVLFVESSDHSEAYGEKDEVSA